MPGDVATVGISDHAQGALGDIVYVEVSFRGLQPCLHSKVPDAPCLAARRRPHMRIVDATEMEE